MPNIQTGMIPSTQTPERAGCGASATFGAQDRAMRDMRGGHDSLSTAPEGRNWRVLPVVADGFALMVPVELIVKEPRPLRRRRGPRIAGEVVPDHASVKYDTTRRRSGMCFGRPKNTSSGVRPSHAPCG